ncbi:hypothetical protein CB1_000719031 [Camelus ferus]|nr:hypothetical protein CB1_000719031 [Camelus ferus]
MSSYLLIQESYNMTPSPLKIKSSSNQYPLLCVGSSPGCGRSLHFSSAFTDIIRKMPSGVLGLGVHWGERLAHVQWLQMNWNTCLLHPFSTFQQEALWEQLVLKSIL